MLQWHQYQRKRTEGNYLNRSIVVKSLLYAGDLHKLIIWIATELLVAMNANRKRKDGMVGVNVKSIKEIIYEFG